MVEWRGFLSPAPVQWAAGSTAEPNSPEVRLVPALQVPSSGGRCAGWDGRTPDWFAGPSRTGSRELEDETHTQANKSSGASTS